MINLYDILLEQMDCAQLIEEGKDPKEVLHYKFQNVPSDTIDAIINIDPTKKKSYSQWTLSKYENEGDAIEKYLSNGRLKQLFNFFKEHQEKQIKDCPSVQEGIDAYTQEEDTVLTKSSEPQTYLLNLGEYVDSDLANDFEIVFNQDGWLIATPNTYEASCKLGENCWWCTANHYGNGRHYYNDYTSDDPLYINFDMTQKQTLNDRTKKTYPFKRYQYHHHSKQFNEAIENQPPADVENIGMPQSAFDFYEELYADFMDSTMNDEERREHYDNLRIADSIYILRTDRGGARIMREYNEDYEFDENEENATYYLYDEDDDRDEVDYYHTYDPNDENLIIYRNNDKTCAILHTTDDEKVLVYFGFKNNRENIEIKEIIKYYVGTGNFDKYLIAVSDDELIVIDMDNNFSWHTDNVSFTHGDDINKLFINYNLLRHEQNEHRLFIETVDDDDYHALYGLEETTLEMLIPKDVPIDGATYFYVNNEGVIEGEFRSYDFSEEIHLGYKRVSNYEDIPVKYFFKEKTESGNFIVTAIKYDKMGEKIKSETVLDKDTKQPITDETFDEVIDGYPLGYFVTVGEYKNVLSNEGKLMFPHYKYYDFHSVNVYHYTYIGLTKGKKEPIGDLIDFVTNEILMANATYTKSKGSDIWLVRPVEPYKNQIDIPFKIFDSKANGFKYPRNTFYELGYKLCKAYFPTDDMFARKEGKFLLYQPFDDKKLTNQWVVKVEYPDGHPGLRIICTFESGLKNIIQNDVDNWSFILKNDMKEIIPNQQGFTVCINPNNTYAFYKESYLREKCTCYYNNIPLDKYSYSENYGCLFDKQNNVYIRLYSDTHPTIKVMTLENRGFDYASNELTQKVENEFQQYIYTGDIKESFFKYYNRLEEAKKHNYNPLKRK